MPSNQFPIDFATTLSTALKDMHRTLIKAEVGEDTTLQNSPYTMLFALIGDPRFKWMGVLSQLITRLDELITDPDEHEPGTLAQIVKEAQNLVGEGEGAASGFRMRHVMALQREPDVGLATGKLRKALADRPIELG